MVGRRRSRHPVLDDIEEPHPSEIGELRLVGVEHELSPVGEPQLADAPLPLALDDGVGEFRRLEAGAGRVVVEEVAVQVEAVDRVVFEMLTR